MKTIIVTGASAGIGLGVAQLFLENGWNVVMNSSNQQNLTSAYESLTENKNALIVAGDVRDPQVGKKLVQAALDNFGQLDALINNAGIFSPKPFLESDGHDLDGFYSVNLKGTFYCSQAAIEQMVKQGNGGAVINMGTVLVDHAIAGFPSAAAVASKGAIHALTRQLAAEFGGDNIRVNTISPGIIRSPLQSKIGVENADGLAGLHLLKRIGETSDIAQTAYHLVNSDFITGATINVDGGHVSGHQFG